MVPPPTPFHILRNPSSPLAAIVFNDSNTLLYAGDQDGTISITDVKTRRVISSWKAHQGGILSLVEWQGGLISHGRDNLILFHHPVSRHGSLSSGPGPSRPPPSIDSSLPTNALNFCRFSFCPIDVSGRLDGDHKGKGKEREALLAVPNLVDSELVDIYLLPSKRRIHASINLLPKPPKKETGSIKQDTGRTGLVMGIHLAFDGLGQLSCVMGYEDGRIELWRCGNKDVDGDINTESPEPWRETWDARMSSGPPLWNKVWETKGHNEAIMGMAVDSNLHRAFTVSADHLIVRYDLRPWTTSIQPSSIVLKSETDSVKSFSTGQIGNASIAISPNSSIVAVGGWDGKIRLFSAISLKPLGTLSYHRETVHCLSFANSSLLPPVTEMEEASTLDLGDGEDESDEEEAGVPRHRWLASGGKDKRIALWALKNFDSQTG